MKRLFGNQLSPDANIRRIRMLYGRLPSGIVSALIGIFLCFVVLLDSVNLDLIKAWSVYMVSVIAARGWIWFMFSNADLNGAAVRRWEWLFAAGALLTRLGWGALFGPLHPPATHPEARIMIVLLVIVVSFAGGVFLSLSNLSFWLPVPAALARLAWPRERRGLEDIQVLLARGTAGPLDDVLAVALPPGRVGG